LFYKKIILFLGLSFISFSFFGQKVEEILSLERQLKVQMPDTLRIKNYYGLGYLYVDVDSNKYFENINEGVKLSIKNRYIKGYGQYFNLLSLRNLMNRNFVLAESQSAKAAYFFLKAKDTARYLNSVYVHLRANYERNKFHLIEPISKRALNLIHDQGYNIQRGKIYGILGISYRKTNLKLTKIILQKSIDCILSSKDYKWLLMPYNNLSRIYSIIGNKDSAIYCAKMAIKYGALANPFQDIDYLIAQTRLSYILERGASQKEAVIEIENLSNIAISLNTKLNQDKGKNTQIVLLKIREAQQKMNNTLLIIGLFLVFILSGFFLNIYFQSKKRQQELTYINQELEFSSYQNQVLLKETNHRVKNNFQMILGLLNLHANSPERNNKNFIQLSISRITAMAKVHEILYRQDVGHLEVLPYLNEILKLTLDSCFDKKYSLKIDVEPEDLNFNLQTILPLGLIVNEMAINTIKHAFNGLDDGKIEIKLNVQNDDYVLTYQDNGSGINVEKISDLSSGLKMIKSLVLQLKGNTEISNENGTKFVIRFKEIGI
jgi:two-component sensor histidine kinase